MITPRETCRICGSKALQPLFTLGAQYVSDFPKPGDPLPPRVPITLDLCTECELVQQRYTAPQDFMYTRHYWYRSGTTETMRLALADVAAHAVEAVDAKAGDWVLDIGSNDGILLRCYPKSLIRVGVEPATNLQDVGRVGIDLMINDFWSVGAVQSLSPAGRFKVVTALGMFYDLEDPNQFIRDVAHVLHPNGVFVAQLMCLKQTVQQCDVGNFAHEHLEFYSLRSLEVLFARHGLAICDVAENAVNGGSYRLYVKHLDTARKELNAGRNLDGYVRVQQAFDVEATLRLNDPATYSAFFQEMVRNRDECVAFLQRQAVIGKQIWVYGASTKGNVIAQWYGLSPVMGVTGAADVSSEKHGRVMVGSKIPIHSEGTMREDRPDYCVVLPYAFLDEFVAREADQEWRKRGGKFVVPLPTFKVV